jgi:flagellar basal body-associated protein FliL
MDNKDKTRIGPAGWIALAVLASLLAAALVYAASAWQDLSGVVLSKAGWVFLVLGVVLTILVGAGLMALVFYSSRHDYDR